MTPRVIQPEDIKKYWPDIKSGLEKILLKDPVQDWIPEDIYSAIQAKRVICVIGFGEQRVDGFFVGYPMKDGTFFTWVGYVSGDLEEGINHMVSYAKSLNCTQVKFGTGRKGWDRVARKLGFQPSIWTLKI